MLELHLELGGKSTRVNLHGLPVVKAKAEVKHATGAGEIVSRRMISGIKKNAPVDFAALRDGDPELDLRMAGERIDPSDTTPAYFFADAEQPKPVSDFNDIDIVFDAAGNEKTRRPHLVRAANLNVAQPIKVIKRIALNEALSSFAPKQTLQLVHTDGLSFDFLRDFALDLLAKNEAAILGAGAKGNMPLVLRNHGTAYRGFLIALSAQADRYQLLMLLSDQELKLPEVKTEPAEAGAKA